MVELIRWCSNCSLFNVIFKWSPNSPLFLILRVPYGPSLVKSLKYLNGPVLFQYRVSMPMYCFYTCLLWPTGVVRRLRLRGPQRGRCCRPTYWHFTVSSALRCCPCPSTRGELFCCCCIHHGVGTRTRSPPHWRLCNGAHIISLFGRCPHDDTCVPWGAAPATMGHNLAGPKSWGNGKSCVRKDMWCDFTVVIPEGNSQKTLASLHLMRWIKSLSLSIEEMSHLFRT